MKKYPERYRGYQQEIKVSEKNVNNQKFLQIQDIEETVENKIGKFSSPLTRTYIGAENKEINKVTKIHSISNKRHR